MNLKTDKKKSPLKGVYIFYSVIIALCHSCTVRVQPEHIRQGGTLYVGISLRMYHAQSQKCDCSPS